MRPLHGVLKEGGGSARPQDKPLTTLPSNSIKKEEAQACNSWRVHVPILLKKEYWRCNSPTGLTPLVLKWIFLPFPFSR